MFAEADVQYKIVIKLLLSGLSSIIVITTNFNKIIDRVFLKYSIVSDETILIKIKVPKDFTLLNSFPKKENNLLQALLL